MFKVWKPSVIEQVEHLYYGPPRIGASKNTCIANLKQIDGANQQWALDTKAESGEAASNRQLFGSSLYIKVAPQCNVGGLYYIGNRDELPRCTCESMGHTL